MGEPLNASGSVARSSGRLYLGLGILLALLGPALYFFQLRAKIFTVPWYVPALGTVGVGSLLLAIVRRRTGWRIASLLLIGLFVGAEWFMIGSLMKLPDYTGPVAVGAPFPTFTTMRADGTAFNQDDLKEQDTALVFFRGRW
jgi:hypothetical protein